MKLNPIRWLMNDEGQKSPGAAGGDAAEDGGSAPSWESRTCSAPSPSPNPSPWSWPGTRTA